MINYSATATGSPNMQYQSGPTITYLLTGATTGSGVYSGSGVFNVGVTTVSLYVQNPCGADTVEFTVTITTDNEPIKYSLVGNAGSTGSDCFRLTTAEQGQVGAVWLQNKISLASDFSIEGTLNFGNNDGWGADGIAFVLQPVCSGLGSAGGGIGYFGITPSLAVEFDTWENGFGELNDPSEDHISLMKNGDLDHNSANNLQGPVTLSNIEDGNDHTYKIEWTASTNTLKVTFDGNVQINYSDDIVTNIFNNNRNVYWGFTAATGSAYNNQSVCISSTSYTERWIV